MAKRLLNLGGRGQRVEIVDLLKRSQGLSVKELAAELKMSYMGVKQHLSSLEKEGYVDTWRRPRGHSVGRPEMSYRLTRRAHDLFPQGSNEVTMGLLRAAESLFGPTAAEKLLYSYFETLTHDYSARIKGDTLQKRALWLTRLRDQAGFMSDCVTTPDLKIIEYHNPIGELLTAYPIIGRFEQELFSKVLEARVERSQEEIGGLYRCTFLVHVD